MGKRFTLNWRGLLHGNFFDFDLSQIKSLNKKRQQPSSYNPHHNNLGLKY